MALAKLVPGLRPDTHTAADALLVFSAGDGGAARRREAVEPSQKGRIEGIDRAAQSFAFLGKSGELFFEFSLTAGNTGARSIQRGGMGLDAGASGSKSCLVCLSAFKTEKLVILQSLDLSSGEGKLVLDCLSLRRACHRVLLGANTCSLLPMPVHLAFEARAEGLFPRERPGGIRDIALRIRKGGLSLRNFRSKLADGLRYASAVKLDGLELGEVFDDGLHQFKKDTASDGAGSRGRRRRNREPREKECRRRASTMVPAARVRRHLNCCDKRARARGTVAEARRSFYRRHRWLVWIAGAMACMLAALGVAAVIVARRFEPFLRGQIVAALRRKFDARVELDSFHVSVVKGIEAQGKGLRIWPPVNAKGLDLSAVNGPLIQLDEFRFHAPLHYKPGEPVVIRVVTLKGLRIDIPPRVKQEEKEKRKVEHDNAEAADGPGPADAMDRPAPPGTPNRTQWLTFVVNRIECANAQLKLETDKPGKLPLVFDIARLRLDNITPSAPMNFDAQLTNPRPVGTIYTTGAFGPWVADDPASSPVAGQYKFEHADLSTFKGIAGTLNSTGSYDGTLRDITVDGVTDTPDFSLTSFGSALPLHTKFHAKVDGTNGDTWLQPVDATLAHSHFTAEGPIVRVGTVDSAGVPHESGRDIFLKVNVDKARIEDFLTLAGRSKPLLNGDVTVKTTLHIPPGKESVTKKLELDGQFHLENVLFTNDDVQAKIHQLSLRGQGHPGDVKKTDPDSVESELDGIFKMTNGVVSLPQLEYLVPGVEVDLTGSFQLEGGKVDFKGDAKMQATVSQMVGGWKGFLLKPADHFFKKDGAGTEVPVSISGTREKPEFGVEFGKMKHTSPEKPGEKPE